MDPFAALEERLGGQAQASDVLNAQCARLGREFAVREQEAGALHNAAPVNRAMIRSSHWASSQTRAPRTGDSIF
jgi:hypothetical protein